MSLYLGLIGAVETVHTDTLLTYKKLFKFLYELFLKRDIILVKKEMEGGKKSYSKTIITIA